jgi:hypothetical protein
VISVLGFVCTSDIEASSLNVFSLYAKKALSIIDELARGKEEAENGFRSWQADTLFRFKRNSFMIFSDPFICD